MSQPNGVPILIRRTHEERVLSALRDGGPLSRSEIESRVPGMTPAVDSRSLLPLVAGNDVVWQDDIICEFHGHHFPYPQRMVRDRRYKLVVNPESVNELYDLEEDPGELANRYDDPALIAVRRPLLHRLYTALVERGDNFYHWMTSMYDIGDVTYDPTLSVFDGSTYDEADAPEPVA